ncbi:hypothetical protein GCM10020367_35880 [Streptomyces sannanensis]|uniref:BACON domain-containing protein n=1 Tax=Streptomyces sannanensis TaxID=285536 RepID=A0ABP6SDK3_9ACTN
MTSSRLEPPTHTTGAHRAQRRGPRTLAQRPPLRYEAYLDGLFTYCLSVLCDYDEATAVLGDVLAISERQYGRCPDGEAGRKAWLYALARWSCLRRLAERKRRRPGAYVALPARAAHAPSSAPPVSEEAAERRRAELARLAWPEAAGTTPEQREALELAVRHQLGTREVAAVLGRAPAAARELLAAAACEVERTRAALAVVEDGDCPTIARLTDDHQVLLSATLRRELVRHVDDCPRCRRTAERVGASGPWPGSAVMPEALPLLEAPRAAVHVAMLHVPRARAAAPRFDRTGFPMDPKDHAARRDRMRARAVTTTVVATVVAAPVLALWAAYRGAPLTGEGRDTSSVTASEADGSAGMSGEHAYSRYENSGNTRNGPVPRYTAGSRAPGISVEVLSPGAVPPDRPGEAAPGTLTVTARSGDGTTALTLTAAGSTPVTWSAWTDAPWLRLSESSGTLAPGESVTVYVTVDHAYEPPGLWEARIGLDPSGVIVRITGQGAVPAEPTPEPSTSMPPPSPTEPTPTPPTPSPSEPTPSPTDSASPAPTVSESPSPSGE